MENLPKIENRMPNFKQLPTILLFILKLFLSLEKNISVVYLHFLFRNFRWRGGLGLTRLLKSFRTESIKEIIVCFAL